MAGKKLFRFSRLDTPDPQARRILWLPLVLAAVSLAAMAVIVTLYILRPSWNSLVALISNGIVFVLDLVCYRLFRRGRVQLGARLLLLAVWVDLALSGIVFEGLGIILSTSAMFLTLLVATQTLKGRTQTLAIVLGALVCYFIFGFDQLPIASTPWRVSTFSTQLAYPIMGGMVLLAAIFLAFQYRNFSITGKLIAAILGVTLAVAILLSAIVFFTSQDRLQTMIGSQLKYSANNQAVIIGDDINKQLAMVKSLPLDQAFVQAIEDANAAYTGSPDEIAAQIQLLDQEWRAAADIYEPLVWDRLNRPISKELRGFRILFPDHVELFVTDRYGAIVAITNQTTDYYQADEDWWQAAYKNGAGATYIGSPEFDESTQIIAMNMAIPVRNDVNEVVGVLCTTFNIRAILGIINSASFGETGKYNLVLPGNPSLMLNQEGEGTAGDEMAQILEKLEQKDYLQASYQGQTYLLSQASLRSQDFSADISNLNWKVLVQQTTEEAFATVQNQLQVSMIVAYLLVGVMSLVGYGMSLVLSRPILQLTGIAERVSAGDLTAQASVEGKDEIGALAKTFNSMTSRLREMVNTLEQRVADRTRAIETSSEVSRRLSTILDQKQLSLAVVEEVQRAFNYYHAHIYMYDDAEENLVMVGGTGEAGQLMLSRGHTIARGRGLVGRAAQTNQVVLVRDTQADPNWLPNPLLPETKSELAVPIAAGERVIGVLDVQHNVIDGLSQQDVDLLQAIANQVAVAVQNATLFTQTQRLADREALANAIGQKIQTASSVEGVLQVVARELGAALKVQRVLVQVGGDPSGPDTGKG
jgi:putative methionine-R-sulfoxide reductase with GAF domain